MAAAFLVNFTQCFSSTASESLRFHHPKARVLLKPCVINLPLSVSGSFKLRRSDLRFNFASKYLILASVSPKKKVPKYFVEKIAALLLGSLVFAGYLKTKPVLAQPFLGNVNLEEKANAHVGSSENGEEIMLLKLLEGEPRNIDTLKAIVNFKMKNGKTKDAVEYVERLIDLQPNEMEWRLLEALCYEMMGDFSKAKSLFKDILKQNPLLLRALHGLAMVMQKKLEGPAVFEMLNEALETASREKKVNEGRSIKILIAQMHVVKGEFDEALSKLESLISDNPRDFRPYLCQGIVYGLQGKKQEANESFEIYKNLVPEEYPQRGFLDDVYLASRTESKPKHFQRTFSSKQTNRFS